MHADRLGELWRYYQIGVINTIFGAALYVLFVYFGINLFLSQLLSHVFGVVFNYYMFKRHVFINVQPKIFSYIGSYVVNYSISVALLAGVHVFIKSPYAAGFLAMALASVFNYMILKTFVFRKASDTK